MAIYARSNDATVDPKTEELLLYVAGKLQDKPTYGSVVLNKLLYYIDNTFYVKTGKPLSKFTYVKQKHGPTPRPKHFVPLCEKLIVEGKMQMNTIERFGKIHKRFVPTKHTTVAQFTVEEIQLIDEVIEQFGDCTATQIENISHKEISWKVASDFEELPFNTYLLTEAEIEEDDLNWAREQIRNHRTVRNN